MQPATQVFLNSLANIAARVVTLGARLVIVPVAVAAMGRSAFGAWVIVGQIFAYLPLVELGLRATITRQAAIRLARGEHDTLNRYVNAAAAYYGLLSLLLVPTTIAIAVYFPRWFAVEPELAGPSRIMVLLAGGWLALTIPLLSHCAVAAGMQRYDVVSGTQILADAVRVALVLVCLTAADPGRAMVLMVMITGVSGFVGAVLRSLLVQRIWRESRFRPWQVDFGLWREMITFGVSTVLFVMSATAAAQLAQILVGALSSTEAAADMRLALELITGVSAFVIAGTTTITPLASKYFGENNLDGIRNLLVDGTRWGGAVGLAGALGLVLFAKPFLHLWVGGNAAYAGEGGGEILSGVARATGILAVAHGLFWFLLPAYLVVNGVGRHRFPALVAVATGVVGSVLVTVVCLREAVHLEEIAWCVLLPMIPGWVLILPIYCCRAVQQSVARFLWHGVGRGILACLPMLVIGVVMKPVLQVDSWMSLVWAALVEALALGAGLAMFAAGPCDRARIKAWILRTRNYLRGAAGSPAPRRP